MPHPWEKQRKPKTSLSLAEQLLCDLLHLECGTRVIADSDALFFTNHISSFIPFFFFPLSNVFEASASTDWSRAAEDCILQNLWLNNLVLCLSTVVVTAYRRCNWFWKVAWICRNETIALVLVHRKSILLKSSTAWSHCCSGVRESQRTYEQWFFWTLVFLTDALSELF